MDSFGLDFADPEEEGDEIIPSVNNDDVQYRSRIIVINSSDRNFDKYPNPNNYTVNFVEDFYDVTELTLLEGTIPATQYNLNDNNNVMYLSEVLNPVINENGDREAISDSQIITKDPFLGFNNLNHPNGSYYFGEGSGPNKTEFNPSSPPVPNDSKKNYPGFIVGKGFYSNDIISGNITANNETEDEYEDGYYNECSNFYKDQLSARLEFIMNEVGLNKYCISFDPFLGKYIFDASPKHDNIVYPYTFMFQGQEVNYGEYSYDKIIKRNETGSIEYDENGEKVYETVYYGEKNHLLRPRSISKLIGFSNQNYNGLISGSVYYKEDYILRGENTCFLKELVPNQYITLVSKDLYCNVEYYSYKIDNIISNTELSVTSYIPITPEIENFECYSARIIPPYLRTLFPYNPVALIIPKCRRIFSVNPIMNKSFMIFQQPENKQGDVLYSDDNQIITKKFNPPQGKLSQLTIKFLNTQQGPPGRGSLYEFGGREHRLVFKVVMMAQSRKYYKGKSING